MDFNRNYLFKKFGYKYGAFIQYLIDFHEMKQMDNTQESYSENHSIWANPTQIEIYQNTHISIPLQKKICDKLKKDGILKTEKRGWPGGNWYKLDLEKIFNSSTSRLVC